MVRRSAGRFLERNPLDREEEPRKRVPGEVDEKEGQRRQERNRGLAVLDPEADRATVRIDQLVFGIGVKEGEAGEEEKVDNQGGGEETKAASIFFEDSLKHRVQK